MVIFGILVGLVVLMTLVIAHEWGHFIAARKSGVVVEEFGIGFPPKAWAKKLKSGLVLSLNWLPIGGFCKMKGEADSAKGKGTYGAASFWQKTKILFAGVVMNWLVAVVIFTILALFGMPRILENQFTVPSDTKSNFGAVEVQKVVEGSPAEQAGIKNGFEVGSIGGEAVNQAADVSALTKKYAGQKIVVEYTIPKGYKMEDISVVCIQAPCPTITYLTSEAITKTALVQLNTESSDKGYLGVSVGSSETLQSTWSAPIVGAGLTLQFTGETFKGLGVMLGNLFSGIFKQFSFNAETREQGKSAISSAGDGVTGPVGILGIIFPSAVQSGGVTILLFAGIISLSLAVMNVLPIPALDGGRWLLMVIFRLRKKELTEEKEGKIVSTSFMVLLGLAAVITVLDITRLV
ncbi:MAG: RIP metalloprotease [Candidatus Nomurabacteria bacterium]|jgi:regulator of sigma E protease|nr:RIP metalloprotease [Candidatus Nomurabacteria bacterium]